MAKTYRSPAGRTVAAILAPARIAEENDGYTAWRDRPDGALEVATVRGSGIDRSLVRDDGTTSWVGHDPLSQSRRWIGLAVLAMPVGVVLCIVVMVGLGTGLLPGRLSWLFLLGMAMAASFVFALESQRPERLLRRTGGRWHEPTKLNGWRPQTAPQLATVERLADAHRGVAQVRETAGDAVDVFVRRWGRRTPYLVDSSGAKCRTELSSTDNGAPWREIRTREPEPD